MKPSAKTTTRRLIEEFGGELLATLQQVMPTGDSEREQHRARVEAKMMIWHTRVARGEHCKPDHNTLPVHWADGPSECVVVNPSATPEQLKAGNTRDAHMHNILKQHGIWDVTFVNVIGCATRITGKAPYRMWDYWVNQLIEAADTQYVLLHGLQPQKFWNPKHRPEQVAGRIGLLNNKHIVMPIGVATTPKERDTQQEHIKAFTSAIKENATLEALGLDCLKCNQPLWAYDQQGMPWCETHFQNKTTPSPMNQPSVQAHLKVG